MNEAVLELCDVRIKMGKRQLFSSASMKLELGQFVTIRGENGIGKSTLLKAIIGLVAPQQGTIKIQNKDLTKIDRRELFDTVSYVQASPHVFPHSLKLKDYFAAIAPLFKNWNHSLYKQLKQEFSLDDGLELRTLSTGEHSKVRLLKALSTQPQILLLDELTSNLSRKSADAVIKTILGLMVDRQMSVVYVTHDLEEPERLSDQVFELTKQGLIQHSQVEVSL